MPAAGVSYPGAVLNVLRRPVRQRPGRRRRVLTALGRVDQGVLHLLRKRGHPAPLEAAVKALATAGEHSALWAAIGAAGAFADSGRRSRWIAAGATGPIATGINFAIKVAVGRQRPLIEEHPRLGRAPTELSFPSAHATSSVAGAIALGRVEPRLRPALLALAAAMCLSRPYLGMHYPSDVLAGAALGGLIGSLMPGVGARPDEERLIDLAIGANGRGASAVGEPPIAAAGRPRPA